jgi:hypothetical protein
MTFEQHTQAALARHEAGFDALPSVIAALDALAKEREGKRENAYPRCLPFGKPCLTHTCTAMFKGGSCARSRERAAALDALARNDAEELWPAPRSVSHWGMFA